jgi:thermitase
MTTRARLLAFGVAVLMAAVGAGWTGPASAATKKFPLTAPNDPLYARQWYLRRIGVPAAWKTTQGKGVVVAVIDTGVERRHPDLKPNLIAGRDTLNDDSDPSDPQGHGTAVSGIIAAVTNNRTGIAGIAPKAKIMPLRACSNVGENSCDTQAVADANMYAANEGADVINMSLGGALPWPPEEAAILYATARGAVVVASAGNSSTPACGFPAFNPASLCVGASDGLDGLADFSSYGARLDVVAPGVGLWTTARPFLYMSFDGTSAAAPVVSGVAALLMSMGATNVQASQIIRATAKDLGLPGYDITYGFGRVDAKAAVELCAQIC